MTAEREQGISFNICKKLGVINTYPTGWKKEVNLVEWNGGPAKIDIRDWDPSHTHMGKGVTLHPYEAKRLRWILHQYLTGQKAETETAAKAEETIPENLPPEEIPEGEKPEQAESEQAESEQAEAVGEDTSPITEDVF